MSMILFKAYEPTPAGRHNSIIKDVLVNETEKNGTPCYKVQILHKLISGKELTATSYVYGGEILPNSRLGRQIVAIKGHFPSKIDLLELKGQNVNYQF